MGAMKVLMAAVSLAATSPLHAGSVADWRPLIAEASLRFGVPTLWIERVMQAESRGRTALNGRPIRSRAGAMGLMQLMPETWAEMRTRLGLGTNPDDPHDNILAGTFYLRLMYDRFGYPGLFAAYNAGPGRYAEHLAGRRALPAETVGYLASVAPSARSPNLSAGETAPPPTIFAVRRDPLTRPALDSPMTSASLFVALSKED